MSSVAAGARRLIYGRTPKPASSPYDETAFAPHAPDDVRVLTHLFHVEVDEEAHAEMPGAVVTPYGLFGPVEHVAGRVDR